MKEAFEKSEAIREQQKEMIKSLRSQVKEMDADSKRKIEPKIEEKENLEIRANVEVKKRKNKK
jgi:hypothetical protein